MRLMEGNQFDTIYHEHFSYFSFLTTVETIFARPASTLFDVEELPTHGGSLRMYAAARRGRLRQPVTERVARTARSREENAGFDAPGDLFLASTKRCKETKRKLLAFLIEAKQARASPSSAMAPRARATPCSTIAASAPISSTTPWTAIPTSMEGFCPGTHIPIFPPEKIRETKPDYVLILPWNLQERDSGAAVLHPRVGRKIRSAHPGGGGLPVIFTENTTRALDWLRSR